MTAERWLRIKNILAEAWERPAERRDAFLHDTCGDDVELRAEVQAFLTAERRGGELLEDRAFIAEAAVSGLARGAFATDSTPETEREFIGTRIGKYTVTALIGKGGMGAVYRAVRTDDFRMDAAIKVLKRGTDTDSAVERFRAERQILAGLQHPNIAHMLDGGATEAGLPYFVMEYVDGTPFLEYAAPFPVRDRLALFRHVCSAVHYAHENLIVHRDIKPANILVTTAGVPKLLDFGIAKLLDPADEGATGALTLAGVRLMTPAYASPEQARGEPVTPATDIYSLGAVLYELITRQQAHTFVRRSLEEIQAEICTREPRRPSALVKGLDRDLDKIVLKAMAKDPPERYRSARELAEDLDRFLADVPVRARPGRWSYRARKFLKRNRSLLAALGAGPVLVFLGAAAVARLRGPRPDTPSEWRNPVFEKIATLGDPAPGGGSFTKQFAPWAVNSRGDLVFGANVDVTREALFLRRKGEPPAQLARGGDSAPGGGVFSSDVAGVSMNDSGDVVFGFGLEPLNSPELIRFTKDALFRYYARDRRVTQIIVPGATHAPGLGVFLAAGQRPALNNPGDLVFSGVVQTPPGASRTGNIGAGIFLMRRDGNVAKIAIPGDPAPGGGAFDFLQNPWINDRGDIAFGAHVAGEECVDPGPGCFESVYFRSASDARIQSIAHQGETGPLTWRYRYAWGPLVNNLGEIAFIGDFAPPPGQLASRGILLHADGVTVPIAGPSLIMPDGRVVLAVNPSNAIGNYSLNNRGEICFNALLTNGDSAFYVYSHGLLQLVVGTGTVVPGIGTIQSVGSYSGNGGIVSDNGQVFFWATLTDKRGVLLLATPRNGAASQ